MWEEVEGEGRGRWGEMGQLLMTRGPLTVLI